MSPVGSLRLTYKTEERKMKKGSAEIRLIKMKQNDYETGRVS